MLCSLHMCDIFGGTLRFYSREMPSITTTRTVAIAQGPANPVFAFKQEVEMQQEVTPSELRMWERHVGIQFSTFSGKVDVPSNIPEACTLLWERERFRTS